MNLDRFLVFVAAALLAASAAAASQPVTPATPDAAPGRSTPLTAFELDADASGVIQTIDNIVNLTVSSRDANDLKAEYRAGFVQGRLQGTTILSARDNAWDHACLLDPSHSFPAQPGPTYDELARAGDILNANYAALLQVREDLRSTDNRPARREQFRKLLPKVKNAATARRVITYTDQNNPLSIFGRWDLGYGETDYPKQIPDGAVDAKVGTSQMVRDFMELSGTLDPSSRATGFWMLFGTPEIHGKPFIWSESLWAGQTLRDVPDRLDGHFTLMPIHLR